MFKKIKISAPARIHVNLFDMSNNGYRQNGGIGFCLNGLDTVIEFYPDHEFQIIDNRSIPYTNEEEKLLTAFLQQMYASRQFRQKMKITFQAGPPPHSGFGTGTATKLACAEAASILNDTRPDQAELIAASGRGGTSGVGISTYFKGGLNVDLGVKQAGLALGPSSARQGPKKPPVSLINIHLPESWFIGVIILLNEKRISSDEEKYFFNKTCPIDSVSVHGSMYQALSGLACAAIENDIFTFCSAINATQTSQWKMAEWMTQSSDIRSLRNDLHKAGASCIGLSSLGPAIYFMAPNIDDLVGKLNIMDGHIFVKSSPNNSGRVVEID